MAAKQHTFQFTVSGNPRKFQYTPAEDWTYWPEDTLRFQTDAGPFTLALIRKDAVDQPGGMRPFQPLTSSPEGALHVAQTGIADGLSTQQRDDLAAAHATPLGTPGFVARYRYNIVVTMPDGTKASDDQKNGEYRC